MRIITYNAETPSGWVAVLQVEGGEPRAFKGELSRLTSQRWAQRIAHRQGCPVTEQAAPWPLAEHVLDYGEPVTVLRTGNVFAWEPEQRGAG